MSLQIDAAIHMHLSSPLLYCIRSHACHAMRTYHQRVCNPQPPCRAACLLTAALRVRPPRSTVDVDELRTSEEWAESRFERLEQFLVVFLGGQGGGGEVVRLKLQTPISVALALLEAAERQIAGQLRAVEGDLAGVEGVRRVLVAVTADRSHGVQ